MITIVTSTLNCKNEFRRTASSIAAQNLAQFQWIVIDGCSTDGTLDVINEFKSYIDYFISEQDSGIYDAWNKACRNIANKWVIFLGAGDIFISNDTLLKASDFLNLLDGDFSYVYGDVVSDSMPPKVLSAGEIKDYEWDLYRPKLPYHQGVFHNAKYFKGDSTFDCTYRVVSDSKLLITLIKNAPRKYMPFEVCIMAPGGTSQTPKNAFLVMREFFRLEKELNYRIPIFMKLRFIFITCTKAIIYKLFGLKIYNLVSSINFKIRRMLRVEFR